MKNFLLIKLMWFELQKFRCSIISVLISILLLSNTSAQNEFEFISNLIGCKFDPINCKFILAYEVKSLQQEYSIQIDGLMYEKELQKNFIKKSESKYANNNVTIDFEKLSGKSIAVKFSTNDNDFHDLNLIINSEGGSAYYGTGERFNSLNQRGYIIPMQSVDKYGSKGVGAYKSIPFVMSSNGFGFWVDSFAEGIFDINATDRTKFNINYNEKVLRVVFIAGPEYSEILSEFVELTGAPRIPPKWSFGLWKSRNIHHNADSVYVDVFKLRKYDIPASVIVLDSPWEKGYNDFEVNETQFENPTRMFQTIIENGFYPCVWLTPFINNKNIIDAPGIDTKTSTYDYANSNNFFVKDYNGKTDLTLWWKGEGEHIDFTNSEAKKWWLNQIEKTKPYGIRAFKADDGEGSFFNNAIFSDGTDVRYMKNKYSLEYNSAMQNYIDNFLDSNGVLITRSGFTGVQNTPFSWAGDNTANFSFEDGLPSVIIAGQNAGMSGIPFWGSDIAGYAGTPSKEVFIRWTQFAVFTPFMQIHMTSNLGPWDFDDETLAIFKRYAKLRMQIFPYIYDNAIKANRTGLPLIRSMAFAFQNDITAANYIYQFMFGDNLLVAPVYHYGEHQTVYLPNGRWIYYWDGKEYDGGQTIEVYAPLKEIPLFVKSASIIPLLPDDIQTLVPRSESMKSEIKTVDNRRILQIYLGEVGSLSTYEGIEIYLKHTNRGYEINLKSENKYDIELRFMHTKISELTNGSNENIPFISYENYTSCSLSNFIGEQNIALVIMQSN